MKNPNLTKTGMFGLRTISDTGTTRIIMEIDSGNRVCNLGYKMVS